MRLALYGLPCAGKSTLMAGLDGIRTICGSEQLRDWSNGNFSCLSEEEKSTMRVRYAVYIGSLTDDVILSDGHYSFMEDVVFTKQDGDVYDAILYLWCPPGELLKRLAASEKDRRFSVLSEERISRWQNFEIESLRSECHKRDKDFYVLAGTKITPLLIKDFICNLRKGYSSHAIAVDIAKDIMRNFPSPCELYIADGDKTVIQQDSFRACGHSTTIFDGDHYTGFQSLLFYLQSKGIAYDISQLERISPVQEVIEEIRKRNGIVISSGITGIWDSLSARLRLPHVFADPMISADTKYFIVKILREHGYVVTAVGDSRNDIYMLREADHGYLRIGQRLSRSLTNESVGNLCLIYDKSPFVLIEQEGVQDTVKKEISVCKSDSGINGSRLAKAHSCLGQMLGSCIRERYPNADTAVLILDRGGRFFGDGVYMEFGGVLYTYDHKKDVLPEMSQSRIVIVDSVINTGKSVLSLIGQIKSSKSGADIVIVTNVIQRQALDKLKGFKVFAVRCSDNSFVGRNQASQRGNTGPDTADRLFNLIEQVP